MKQDPLKTALVEGQTIKTDERVNFFGEVDELSANIMQTLHFVESIDMQMEMRKLVNLLSTMMGEVAGGFGHIGQKHIDELLEVIAKYEQQAGAFKGFVVPGETLMGARFHILRTVTRRAERAYAKVFEKYGGSDYIFEYLNKMSTLFYAIARTFDEK